jgi:hypothetical protein
MATARRSKKSDCPTLRVGSRVSFVFGGSRVRGTIIEDRGNIGYQGRRLFTVRLKRWPEDIIVELPAEDLRAA